jgi:hypothetical protein
VDRRSQALIEHYHFEYPRRHDEISLIFSDVILPGEMNGIALFRKSNSRSPGRHSKGKK